jgi:hypothetical protein
MDLPIAGQVNGLEKQNVRCEITAVMVGQLLIGKLEEWCGAEQVQKK